MKKLSFLLMTLVFESILLSPTTSIASTACRDMVAAENLIDGTRVHSGEVVSFSEAFGDISSSQKTLDLWDFLDSLIRGETATPLLNGKYSDAGVIRPNVLFPSEVSWTDLLSTNRLRVSYSERNPDEHPLYAEWGHKFHGYVKAKVIYKIQEILSDMERNPSFQFKLWPLHEDYKYPGFSSLSEDRFNNPLLAAESIQEAFSNNSNGLKLLIGQPIPSHYIEKIYVPAGYAEKFFKQLEDNGITHIGERLIHEVVEIVYPTAQKLLFVPNKGTYPYDFYTLRDPFTSIEARISATEWLDEEKLEKNLLIFKMLEYYKKNYGVDYGLTPEEIKIRVMEHWNSWNKTKSNPSSTPNNTLGLEI